MRFPNQMGSYISNLMSVLLQKYMTVFFAFNSVKDTVTYRHSTAFALGQWAINGPPTPAKNMGLWDFVIFKLMHKCLKVGQQHPSHHHHYHHYHHQRGTLDFAIFELLNKCWKTGQPPSGETSGENLESSSQF